MPTKQSKLTWNFDHSYAQLPADLFSKQPPIPVADPKLVYFNEDLAKDLGLADLASDQEHLAPLFAGNQLPEDAQPIAQAYAGHQFGYFNRLGDGRAVLLGEHITPSQQRVDIQFKGSGPTPYSRRGDGRATLAAMLREYIISEAMYHLGIPTTRSLAVVTTGEPVYREVIHKGAVLTRVAASHIRVGTFEYAKQFTSPEVLRTLTDYTIQRHYPELAQRENPALALLEKVMAQQIDLILDWMRVGFIHGVMNTDNMSIAGETIDYGPCAFMNAYDPATVFSSIDTNGRYAYGNQPSIAHWNLVIFASALLPIIDEDQELAVKKVRAILDIFPDTFSERWGAMMLQKIGIAQAEANDRELVNELMRLMKTYSADYTNLFVALQSKTTGSEAIFQAPDFQAWQKKWERRIQTDEPAAIALMQQQNPQFIARNHLVENALTAATEGDFRAFDDLLERVRTPYSPQTDLPLFQSVPAGFDADYQTFCGT